MIHIWKTLGASGEKLLALGNQRFPAQVRLLSICTGELPAAISLLSVKEELKKCPLHFPGVLTENLDKKYIYIRGSGFTGLCERIQF